MPRPTEQEQWVFFWEENEIQNLDWAACSPWYEPHRKHLGEVTRYLNNLQHSPTNVNQLRVALNGAWAAIPNETLASLVSSMPRRIQALLEARGGYTRFWSVNKLRVQKQRKIIAAQSIDYNLIIHWNELKFKENIEKW